MIDQSTFQGEVQQIAQPVCKQLYKIFPDSEKGDKEDGDRETYLSPE